MHKITRVGVLSIGKLLGLTGSFFGLVIGLIYGAVLIVAGIAALASGSGSNGPPGAVFIVMGFGVMIGLPIMYGLMSFVMGLLYGLVLNLAMGFIGGIELEIQAPDSVKLDPI